VLVERFAPVPPLFALALRQGFAFFGAFIKAALPAAMWDAVVRQWIPGAPDNLLRHPDGHFVQTFSVGRGRIPLDPAGAV
jgi:hypothetical protein